VLEDELRTDQNFVGGERGFRLRIIEGRRNDTLNCQQLNSLSLSSLCALNGRAVPFEGFLDFSRQGRFARGHEVDEFFFADEPHARIILSFVAQV
jgi:hypothetical protein